MKLFRVKIKECRFHDGRKEKKGKKRLEDLGFSL